jgi:hypothetical protein
MIVEFDVFSGRPNPTWSLSEEQIIELQGALRDLPPADKPPGEFGLGYRGFLILNPDRAGGLATHIRIYDGIVTMVDDQVQSYQDVRGVERRLLVQASQYGYKTIVESIVEGMPNL